MVELTRRHYEAFLSSFSLLFRVSETGFLPGRLILMLTTAALHILSLLSSLGFWYHGANEASLGGGPFTVQDQIGRK